MEYIGGKWIVATSTGPDSMALLSMCLTLGIDCAVAHVNYHQRAQADIEEKYIKQFCNEHHLQCFVCNKDFVWQGNFEAAARKWRYDFFVELVQAYHYDGVLVAHHRDDLLETYCMQIEKNIIPEVYGLTAQTYYQNCLVVRPLLKFYKNDLETYCKAHNIDYFTDQSNQDTNYTRNRFRHQILAGMSLSEKERLYQEIILKNKELKCIRQCAYQHINENSFFLDVYRLQTEAVRLTMLRILMENIGLEGQRLAHRKEIDEILRTHDDFCFEQDRWQLVVDCNRCFWMEQPQAYFACCQNLEQVMTLDGKGIFHIILGQLGNTSVTVEEEDFPLIIRTWRHGDSIQMKFGRKSVSRYCIDHHIPLYQRKMLVVVENKVGEIILLPGLGCNINHYSRNPNFNVIMCYNS